MTNIYPSSNSVSLQILETAPGAAESRAAVLPEAKSGPVPLNPVATSLPVLVRSLRRGHRWEDVAWLLLAGSAIILLALSLCL